ncbi:hypothetical protein CBFG_04939 [Clostridiales bacterium 1_7_47FAA]|nr:hypothetical protein CBFG_04939 [Clostridiales bacterium 1_7_47FAA]
MRRCKKASQYMCRRGTKDGATPAYMFWEAFMLMALSIGGFEYWRLWVLAALGIIYFEYYLL